MQKMVKLVLCCLLIAMGIQGQKLMKTPPELTAEPLNVQFKMAFKNIQYNFGHYHLVDYKQGKPTGSNERAGLTLFPKEVSDQVFEQASYTFTNDASDTAYVLAGIISSKQFEDGRGALFYKGDKTYKGGTQVFTALIAFNHDTSHWTLKLNREEQEGIVTAEKQMTGSFDNGVHSFILQPVSKYNNDKKAMSGAIGFLFKENDSTVAAVQFAGLPLKVQKQSFVWFSEGLTPDVKFALAAACQSLLLRMHMTMGSTIQQEGIPGSN